MINTRGALAETRNRTLIPDLVKTSVGMWTRRIFSL